MGKEYERIIKPSNPIYAPESVLYSDDFEGTMSWTTTGEGDYSVTNATSPVYIGSKSLLAKNRVTNPGDEDQVIVRKFIAHKDKPLLTIEFYFTLSNSAQIASLKCSFMPIFNELQYHYSIWFLPSTSAVKYEDADFGQTAVPGITWAFPSSAWQYFKLTVDMTQNAYKYFQLNSSKVDMQNIPTWTEEASAGEDYIYIKFDMTNIGATSPSFSLDNLIVSESTNP